MTLPDLPPQEDAYLVWNDQAEATLYRDGEPYCGLDLAHRECRLPRGIAEFWIEAVCIRTGIWLDGSSPPLDDNGSLYRHPALVTRDDLAWKVHHDLRVLLDVLVAEHNDYQPSRRDITASVRMAPHVWRATPLFRGLCAGLDEAVNAFDQGGLPAFDAALGAVYEKFRDGNRSVKAVLTGHAHIDLVWLWPERVGEFKAVHTFATQLRLLERYPEFRFGYSQPASYRAVERRSEKLFRRVRERIGDGRWEATGMTYVEADTQLPCGEGLWRCFRLGQEEFAELRGGESPVLWLPDVFGYSGCLPQLIRSFGGGAFFTTKLSWSNVNRFPHTSFLWRGDDGSEVLAHIVLLHDYNEAVQVDRLREDALHHQQSAVHPEMLIPTGFGDGGGGVTEAMIERARRLADLQGVPRVEWGSIDGFFARMEAIRDRLPVYAGELVLELHRGVFTTHRSLKQAFRGLERALQVLEAAHVATGQGPVDKGYWRRLSFSQFHDCIPGSSIWEVYSEIVPELAALADKAVRQAGESVVQGVAGPTHWFNPLPWARNWVVGRRMVEVPPLGFVATDAASWREVAPVEADVTGLKSDRVQAVFTADGQIASLRIDGAPVSIKAGEAQLFAYADRPAAFPAWDVDRQSLVTGLPARVLERQVVRGERGEAAVLFSCAVAENSRVAIRYTLVPGEPVLRISYRVNWRDPEYLLKAVFATRYRGRLARFGSPFGSSLRSQWPGDPKAEASWEVPGSRWAIVLDDRQCEGLAVITESNYGFSVRDGVIGVSLLRSAYVTEGRLHGKIRECPDRPMYADMGEHEIQIALGVHGPEQKLAALPATLADSLFVPCLPAVAPERTAGLRGFSGEASLVPSWAEPLGAGSWVLRLHEVYGSEGSLRLLLEDGWRARKRGAAHRDRPLNAAEKAAPAAEPGCAVIDYRGYEIVSVEFWREADGTR